MKKKTRTPKKQENRIQVVGQQRSYRELSAMGGQNSDWAYLGNISEDGEVWQNAWALTSRVRDLFRSNSLYIAYRETLWANVLGANGINLRMRAKETEDRIIHTPDDEREIRAFEHRRNRVFEFYATKAGVDWQREVLLHVMGTNGSRAAQVKVGQPDVYANVLIEKMWREWQRAEFCDVRQTRNYNTIRQLRLISAVRDGDFFLRMVMDPRVNKFGFSLQLINSEWCDRWYNAELPNGNVVRMGIEYQWNSWGLGKPVAYYFIKRQPFDWQFSQAGGFSYSTGHDRISADEIIHYTRATDADSTRPAPWVATTIPSSRQRDQAMLAEVVAWREAACKTGFYYSDILPEGGEVPVPDPRTGFPTENLAPGETRGLPWGVKFQGNNPLHPNANVKEFRMASIQDGCAGMPGANYSTMANDYSAINFSAGRLQRLDTNETNMMLQTFDIDYAENKIFEKWLRMALTTGAIPLPLQKFDKFNQKAFQGRRWQGVDVVKDNQAAAMAIANKLSSRTRECADKGLDFEEVLFEIAEENMLIEMLGMKTETTVEAPPPPTTEVTPEDDDEPPESAGKPKKKPVKTKSRV